MAGSELLEACSTDSCCLTAAGAGAITGLNMLSSAKVQALEFARVNSSAVVATGCGCGPSADAPAAQNECQCKSGVDVNYYIPLQQVAAKRVDNQHAFIANDQLWPDENQMRSQDEEQRPQSGCCGGGEVTGQPSFNGHNSAGDGDNCCVNVAASRSEDLLISHKPIMAGDK